MSERTPVAVTESGVTITPVAPTAATGDNYPANTGKTYLLMENGHATDDSTFTINALTTAFSVPGKGLTSKANVTVTVGAGERAIAGPFPPDGFNDASDGLVWIATGGTPLAFPFSL